MLRKFDKYSMTHKEADGINKVLKWQNLPTAVPIFIWDNFTIFYFPMPLEEFF